MSLGKIWAENCPNRPRQTTGARLIGGLAALVAGLALVLPAPAAAGWRDGTPPEGRLEYEITRDGSPVGQQVVEVQGEGDSFVLRTHIEIEVGFLSLTLYRFRHDAVESWAGGRLTGFVSRSDDDGKDRAVELDAEGERLVGFYNDNPIEFPGDILPASLWHPGTIAATVLLDPIRGRERRVTVEDRGPERIVVAGQELETHRYAMSGQIARELWYDDKFRLVQVRFPAKDGSDIQVTLK